MQRGRWGVRRLAMSCPLCWLASWYAALIALCEAWHHQQMITRLTLAAEH